KNDSAAFCCGRGEQEMADLVLVYGMRLLPADEAKQAGSAPGRLNNGKVAASLAWPMGTLHAAQEATRVQPQATAEDVLASLIHHSAAIFAGEVYAIRVPQAMKGAADVDAAGIPGGLSSSCPDAVEGGFGVDAGLRGATTARS